MRSLMPRIYDAWIFMLGATLGAWLLGYNWKTVLGMAIGTAFLYGWADVYDPTKRPPDHYLSDYDLETLPEKDLLKMGIPQEKIDIARGRIPDPNNRP